MPIVESFPFRAPAAPLKVLVVEDESIVALDIENMLEEIGCKVVASVPRLVKALYLASSLDIDLAVLDINLAGEVVYPLAFRLAERGIPFVFSTGYSTATLPSELRDRPLVKKPVTLGRLKKAVSMATTGMRIVS
jgi:two-component SAPR family response regulator